MTHAHRPRTLALRSLLAAAVLAGTGQAQQAPPDRPEVAFPLQLVGWSESLAGEGGSASPAGSGGTPALEAGSGGQAGIAGSGSAGSGGGQGTVLHFGELGELGDLGEVGEQLRFLDVPLPDGTTVSLDMTRANLDGLGFGLFVDGAPAPGLLDKLGLDVYVGTVSGVGQSSAALAFSTFGSRGWIQRGDDLFHLMARAGPGGSWAKSTSQMVDDATLVAWGNSPHPVCEADALPALPPPTVQKKTGVTPLGQGAPGTIALSKDLLECSIAIETDDQLYAIFNDLNAEAAYVTTLLTWLSYRYEEQVETVLTFPYVMFYTQGNDPWTTQENGGSSFSLLTEFQAAWTTIPQNARLAAFYSGAPLGGGVAYLPGLCNAPYNFSVSGNIGGTVQFPVVQQGGNWDFIVLAHELGHNFGAPHTQDWCPPLDECPPSAYFGGCQTQQVCSSSGTVMSYCHLCSPGTANITTYFHPLSAGLMRGTAESNCLPTYARAPTVFCVAKVNSQGCTPAIDASGHPTLSGLDNFTITASNLINQQDGLLFFGPTQGSKPFQGGTKCVLAPSWRTPVQNTGGTAAGTVDCSGGLDTSLSHLLFAAKGVGPGTTLFAQYWSLDPAGSFGTNLTDALRFHIEP